MTAPSASHRTGFIGLGSQGGPMAERMLAAGFPLGVWARRPEALAPFVQQGAVAAATVADLAVDCDHMALCVVDDAGVAEICEQSIPAMKPGSLLVVHSTISPDSCERIAAQCANRDIGFVDAPVSGGGPAAASGELTVMCGGSPVDFERARPVLESFAGTLVHLGPAGSGQRAKIVNNALMAANMGAAHAAMSVGSALGIDRTAFAELIKASSGRSFGFEVYSRLPSAAAFAHGAPLLAKDVGLLGSILPDDDASCSLRNSAAPFLRAAGAF